MIVDLANDVRMGLVSLGTHRCTAVMKVSVLQIYVVKTGMVVKETVRSRVERCVKVPVIVHQVCDAKEGTVS